MTNVTPLHPKKKLSPFTLAMIVVFGTLIAIRGYDLATGISWLYRKHSVEFFAEPMDVNNHFMTSAKGKPVSVRDFNGKMTVLAFWAPWCGYCAKEFPQMDRIAPALRQKGIEVVPIVRTKEPLDQIQDFYRRGQIENLTYYTSDDQFLYGRLWVQGFPSFILLDKEGNAVARIRPNWAEDDILQLFDQIALDLNANPVLKTGYVTAPRRPGT